MYWSEWGEGHFAFSSWMQDVVWGAGHSQGGLFSSQVSWFFGSFFYSFLDKSDFRCEGQVYFTNGMTEFCKEGAVAGAAG